MGDKREYGVRIDPEDAVRIEKERKPKSIRQESIEKEQGKLLQKKRYTLLFFSYMQNVSDSAASAAFVLSVHACQGENKFGSDTLGADDVDMFIMRLDRFFDDRESESGAFFIFAAGKV